MVGVVVYGRRDRTLQMLVYKLVPGLYRSKFAVNFVTPSVAGGTHYRLYTVRVIHLTIYTHTYTRA